jgi:hypothetical protein
MTTKTVEQEAEQALNKAAAIRLVRDHLLAQGEEPETAEIARILARTKWTSGDNLKDKNYISALLSQDRAKAGGPPGKPGRRPRLQGEPTVTELKLVREWAEANGSLEELGETLQRIDKIVCQVGGYDRLMKCMAFYRELYAPQLRKPENKTKKSSYRSIDDE